MFIVDGVDHLKETGRTTAQLIEAPRRAIFVWPRGSEMEYIEKLAAHLERDDLIIWGPQHLQGAFTTPPWGTTAIVLDHSAHADVQEAKRISEIEAWIGLRPPNLKDVTPYAKAPDPFDYVGRISVLETCLRNIVAHWNEFGTEMLNLVDPLGFDEIIDHASEVLHNDKPKEDDNEVTKQDKAIPDDLQASANHEPDKSEGDGPGPTVPAQPETEPESA